MSGITRGKWPHIGPRGEHGAVTITSSRLPAWSQPAAGPDNAYRVKGTGTDSTGRGLNAVFVHCDRCRSEGFAQGGGAEDHIRSKHSVRTVRTHRSAKAIAPGTWIGAAIILTPSDREVPVEFPACEAP